MDRENVLISLQNHMMYVRAILIERRVGARDARTIEQKQEISGGNYDRKFKCALHEKSERYGLDIDSEHDKPALRHLSRYVWARCELLEHPAITNLGEHRQGAGSLQIAGWPNVGISKKHQQNLRLLGSPRCRIGCAIYL